MILKDKNVFLTGGSRGLGRHAVIQLVKHGANVAFTYLSSDSGAKETKELALKERPDAKVEYYKMNVQASSEVDAVTAQAIRRATPERSRFIAQASRRRRPRRRPVGPGCRAPGSGARR